MFVRLKIARTQFPGLRYESDPKRATSAQVHIPNSTSFLALHPHSISWSRGRAQRLCGSQVRAGVRPVGGSRELTVSTRTKMNMVILR